MAKAAVKTKSTKQQQRKTTLVSCFGHMNTGEFSNYRIVIVHFVQVLLVEHDRFRILVHHLRHVSQNILLSNDSK